MEHPDHSEAGPRPRDDTRPLPFEAMTRQPGATYYMPLDLPYEERVEANALLEPPDGRPYEKVVRLDNGLLRTSIHEGDDNDADEETDEPSDDQIKGHWNEDAVVRRMVVRYGNELRYCHAAAAWFVWDGVVWRRDINGHVQGLVRASVRDGPGGFRENGRLLGQSARFSSSVERFARDEPAFAVASGGWDKDTMRLGTPGGAVDLTTGVLHPADPADRITRVTAVAPAEQADCPLWRRFLDEAMGGDQTLVAFLQRFLGYALTGETCEHTLLFGLGEGGNGKSVFVNTVRGIFGDYAAVAVPDLLAQGAERRAGKAHSTEIAMLDGARLVTASETEEGRVWADGRLKLLTGGDPVTARFLGRDHFTFLPRFKLIIVGNHMPVLRTVDAAIRRRLCVVPFVTQPAMPDRRLEARLKAEWPAILRWMIEGCLAWRTHGLGRPDAITTATDAYLGSQDIVGQFLAETCDRSPNGLETSASLYAAWCAYAKAIGETPGTQRRFAARLERHGLTRERMRHTRFYRGVRLLRSGELQDEMREVRGRPAVRCERDVRLEGA